MIRPLAVLFSLAGSVVAATPVLATPTADAKPVALICFLSGEAFHEGADRVRRALRPFDRLPEGDWLEGQPPASVVVVFSSGRRYWLRGNVRARLGKVALAEHEGGRVLELRRITPRHLDFYAGFFLGLTEDVVVATKGPVGIEQSWGSAALPESFGLDASISRFSVREDLVKVDTTLADLSLKACLHLGGRSRVVFAAGPGLAFVDTLTFGNHVLSEDWTAHLGAGAFLWGSDRVYLHPDVRGHWFKKGDDQEIGWKASLDIGVSF